MDEVPPCEKGATPFLCMHVDHSWPDKVKICCFCLQVSSPIASSLGRLFHFTCGQLIRKAVNVDLPFSLVPMKHPAQSREPGTTPSIFLIQAQEGSMFHAALTTHCSDFSTPFYRAVYRSHMPTTQGPR